MWGTNKIKLHTIKLYKYFQAYMPPLLARPQWKFNTIETILNSQNDIFRKVRDFFITQKISLESLVQEIKLDFSTEHCLIVD